VQGLSRHDGKFTAAEEAPVDAAELLCALATQARAERCDRTDAIARYLSGGDGWREALHRLGGAFAGDAAAALLPGEPSK